MISAALIRLLVPPIVRRWANLALLATFRKRAARDARGASGKASGDDPAPAPATGPDSPPGPDTAPVPGREGYRVGDRVPDRESVTLPPGDTD